MLLLASPLGRQALVPDDILLRNSITPLELRVAVVYVVP